VSAAMLKPTRVGSSAAWEERGRIEVDDTGDYQQFCESIELDVFTESPPAV